MLYDDKGEFISEAKFRKQEEQLSLMNIKLIEMSENHQMFLFNDLDKQELCIYKLESLSINNQNTK